MKNRYLICIILASLLISFNVSAANTQVANSSDLRNGSITIISRNTQIDFSSETEINEIIIHWKKVLPEEASISLELLSGNKKIIADLSGILFHYDGIKGFNGAFEGRVLNGESNNTPITMNLVYASSDKQLATVAMGCADTNLSLMCFGSYSEEINEINKARIKNENLVREKEKAAPERALMVDGTIRYKNSSTYAASGNELLTISSYHANEWRNASSTIIYGKVNSHVSGFLNYAKNAYSLNAQGSYLNVYPDKYIIDMRVYDNQADYISHYPSAGSSSLSFNINVILPYVGSTTLQYALNYSSCSVSITNLNSASSQNRIVWTNYKMYGWTSSVLDGYYNTNSGGGCKGVFQMANSISVNTPVSVRMIGQMRYQCDYIVPVNNHFGEMELYTYYLWTPEASCWSTITIVP